MNDQQIEQDIQAAGANVAPRITPADVEANIASEHYFTAGQANGLVLAGPAALPGGLSREQASPTALDLLTFCVLVLRNGFTVTGESACASPENFDAEIGRKIARANAVQKIWPLMGYELRSKLAGHIAIRTTTRADAPQVRRQEQAPPTPDHSEESDAIYQPYQLRMISERLDLEAKLRKLDIFIRTNEAFDALPPEEKLDLVEQHYCMGRYSEMLARRIARFGAKA
jgi:hypothetical protein